MTDRYADLRFWLSGWLKEATYWLEQPRTPWDETAGLAALTILAAGSAICHPRQFVRARRAQVAYERQIQAWARAEEARR